MDRHLELILLAVLAIGMSTIRASVASALQGSAKGLPQLELTFDVGGKQAKWAYDPQTNQQSQELNGCTLSMHLQKKGIQQILRFKLQPPKGEKLIVNSYVAKVTIPTETAHAVMVPNTRILAHTLIYYHEHRTWPEKKLYRCLLPEEFGETANANCEAPYIQLTDNKGNNRLAVGWAAADVSSGLNGKGDKDSYVLTLARENDLPWTGDSLEDALIISTADEPWLDVENAYAKTFDKYNNRPKRAAAPAWTSKPVFCTWYCWGDHIDQEQVLQVARKCKELGFGTILIDAGWDTAPDGGWGDWENGNLGDFIADKKRFPNLADAVKQMHDMGLRVELWYAPFWQGRKSNAYQQKTKTWHAHTEEGESRDLCPRYPGTRELLKESYANVAKMYDIDGMWFDGADGVPMKCTANHEHLDQPMGEAFVDCLAAAREGLRSVKSDAITEVRVLHGNLNSKRSFDIIQPSDAPHSHEMLRLAGIHLRPWTYDILLKNDPMIWADDASAAAAAKFMATMICNGVPAMSVDFLKATEDQCRVTKAWLAFYDKHKKTLLKGKFELFGKDFGTPDMLLIGDKEAMVYLINPQTDEVTLPATIKKAYVLNCTNSDTLKLKIAMADGGRTVQTFNPDWTARGTSTAQGGKSEMSLAIPQGGAALVTVE